ncbi:MULTISPECIES: hypothetical protein [unclassified Sinorhizobium]|uniref:hypothetical protein n=1 Tax=unclassified Sinorhizobium TaxID=2613772 RepID=UPI0035269EB6
MSTLEFSSRALKQKIAPAAIAASVSARIRYAANKLGWSYNRTKDIWYADERSSVSGDELVDIEEYTGLRYARKSLRENEKLIETANALLDGGDTGSVRASISVLRKFIRIVARTRAAAPKRG